MAEIDPSRCKRSVIPNESFGWVYPHQCHNKVWKDGYCKMHHPDTVKEKDEARSKAFQEKSEKSDWMQLHKAIERIKELEVEIEQLKKIIHTQGKEV